MRGVQLNKGLIDIGISKLRGSFDKRTPKELLSIFKIDYRAPDSMLELELQDSSQDRLTGLQQEFLYNSIVSFNNTFPAGQQISSEFDELKASTKNLESHIEHFLRSMLVTAYKEGVTLSKSYKVHSTTSLLGEIPYVISVSDGPRVCVRPIVQEKRDGRGTPIEFAFSSAVFELYSLYWSSPIWPVYECITDYNSWFFIKYDGSSFFRSKKLYKLAIHNTSIFSLAIKFLDIIESNN